MSREMPSAGQTQGKGHAVPGKEPGEREERAPPEESPRQRDAPAAGHDAEGDRKSGRSRSVDSEDDRRRLPSLRWTATVRVQFLQAIESVDITKHWRHGSKAAFWYQVLETFWRQQGYENMYKQPHINSLNMKFFEIYDAYMEGTGEAGPSGSGARTARSKLGPRDLTKEEIDICARIKQRFEPIR